MGSLLLLRACGRGCDIAEAPCGSDTSLWMGRCGGGRRVHSVVLCNLRCERKGSGGAGVFFFVGVKRVFALKSDQLLPFEGLFFWGVGFSGSGC